KEGNSDDVVLAERLHVVGVGAQVVMQHGHVTTGELGDHLGEVVVEVGGGGLLLEHGRDTFQRLHVLGCVEGGGTVLLEEGVDTGDGIHLVEDLGNRAGPSTDGESVPDLGG